MTKCRGYWKIVGEFKKGIRHMRDEEGNPVSGIEGLQRFCGEKGYGACAYDFRTYDTLELIGEKLGIAPEDVLRTLNLTAEAIKPLAQLRKYEKKHKTIPSELQEEALKIIMPQLISRDIKPSDIKRAVNQIKKPARRKKYIPEPRKFKELETSSLEIDVSPEDLSELKKVLYEFLAFLKELKERVKIKLTHLKTLSQVEELLWDIISDIERSS